MGAKLRCFPDDVSLATTAAADWLERLAARSKSPDAAKPYCVALSGGRIARTFFSEVARLGEGKLEFFNRVHFFWADERCVPPTDPESNYAVANQLLFGPLQLPEAHIHRLRGEQSEALALRDALENIRTWVLLGSGNGVPVFDMIFLGMGEDGHVASLFPGEPEEVMADIACYRAVTAVKPPPRRFTLGYSTIAAAREVWVMVSGAGKQGALKESLSAGGKTPLARVLRQRRETSIYTDVEP